MDRAGAKKTVKIYWGKRVLSGLNLCRRLSNCVVAGFGFALFLIIDFQFTFHMGFHKGQSRILETSRQVLSDNKFRAI